MPAPLPNPLSTPSSDTRFGVCVEALLRREGGWSNNPADHGGATNFGISLRFALLRARVDPVLAKRFDLDMDGDIDARDIAKLDHATAVFAYRRAFWDEYRCGALPAPLDGIVFDQAVNGGGVAAIKLLQRALNAWNHPHLIVDGEIGGRTIAAAHYAAVTPGLDKISASYRVLAASRYRQIAADDPTQQRFLAGWVARAEALGRG